MNGRLSVIDCTFILFLLYLLYRLSVSNPFDRCLFSKKYTLMQVGSGYQSAVLIAFKKPPDSHVFRNAIYDCAYSFPNIRSIRFVNLGRLQIRDCMFEDFYFDRLDFSQIPSVDFNCNEPFTLPASYIVLPKDAKEIPLRYCHPNIKRIAIPCDHLVPALEYVTFDAKTPIQVHSDFEISVPHNLICEHKNNPVWNSIVLIDENGNLFHPTFSYYSE